MDSLSTPDRPDAAADLKTWLRGARRRARLTQPQLAKRMDVHTEDVFRWEHRACDDLPDAAQLQLIADILGARVPTLPAGLIREAPEAPRPPAAVPEAAPAPEPSAPITQIAELKSWMRRVRKRAGLTQAALADEIEISGVTVHKWEHQNSPERPPWRGIERIAAACGVEVPEIDPALELRGREKVPVPLDPGMPPAGSLMEEIAQTAERLAHRYDGIATQERNAALFVDYYGRGLTLQAIGEKHELTRERVRQVIARLMELVPVRPPPKAKYLELAERCRTLDPMPVAQAEGSLADLLGGVSLPSAITYGAHVLGEGLPVEIDTTQAVPMLLPRGQPNWVASALRHARRMIRFNGAAIFDQVWAATQAENEGRIGMDAVRTALQAVYGFAWLDPTQQWFWFGPEDGPNRTLDWTRRVLASAGRRVDVEHVHSALARFTALYDEESRTTAVMPTAQVLLAMLASCPDIEVKQADDLKLIDTALVPDVEPGSVVEQVIELLRGQGGVMARGDIVEALVNGRGVVPVSLSVQLACSPMLRRLDHGVYAIRGWQISPESAARAWRRNLSSSATDIAYGPDGSIAWDTTITAAVMGNDRMYLPQAVAGLLARGVLEVEGGGEVRVVGATENVQLRGLGAIALAMGGQAGDRFRLTLWPERRALRLDPI